MTQQAAASFGQGLAIASRIAECFPRDVPHDEVQAMIDDTDFWREHLAGVRAAFAARIPAIPEVGVEFDLTLKPVTGLSIGTSDGYNSNSWQFTSAEITETRTGRFKLVQVGYKSNLDAVRTAIFEGRHGRVPEGQLARTPFFRHPFSFRPGIRGG